MIRTYVPCVNAKFCNSLQGLNPGLAIAEIKKLLAAV